MNFRAVQTETRYQINQGNELIINNFLKLVFESL